MPCLRPRGAMDLNRHRVGFVPGPGAQIVHYSGPFGTFGYPACRYGGPMPIYALGDKTPRIHPDSFIHPDAVIIGDLFHSPIQMKYPDLFMRLDYDGVQSTQSRQSFLQRYGDTSTLCCTAHFPSPSMGHIKSSPSGYFCEMI